MLPTFLLVLVFPLYGEIAENPSHPTQASAQHFAKAEGISESEQLRNAGQLQLLGQCLADPILDLHTDRNLMERGLSRHAVEKVRSFLFEAGDYDRWVKSHLNNLITEGDITGEMLENDTISVMNRVAGQWVAAFYAELTRQEARVLDSFMDEFLTEGLSQWVVREKNADLPYLAQSYAFVEVTDETAIKVHHLKLKNYLPDLGPDFGHRVADEGFRFLNAVPPLLNKVDPLILRGKEPGLYFATEHLK